MKRWLGTGAILALGFGWSGATALGQVVERERDVTITGPRGRSIQRDMTSVRGPGFVDRQTTIQRPGGTFQSNTMVQRGGFGGGARGFAPPGRWGGWGQPRFFGGGPVVVNPGLGIVEGLAIGAGSFGLGMLAGNAMNAPPPGYAIPPQQPNVVYAQPQPYSPTPPPAPTVVVDPVAKAIERLSSYHDNSRREAVQVLGRLRDPRAVPGLVDRLKNDWNKDVRAEAATALGEIGDPSAIQFLDRARVYDKREHVRDAATVALSRLSQVQAAMAAAPPANAAGAAPGSAAPAAGSPFAGSTAAAPPERPIENVPASAAIENVPPPPTPDAGLPPAR